MLVLSIRVVVTIHFDSICYRTIKVDTTIREILLAVILQIKPFQISDFIREIAVESCCYPTA